MYNLRNGIDEQVREANLSLVSSNVIKVTSQILSSDDSIWSKCNRSCMVSDRQRSTS